MVRTKIISKILFLLSIIFVVIAIVGTVLLLIHYSKGGVYVEAELKTWEIGVSFFFGYINLLFASLCFAQHLLVSDNGNSKTACIARKVLLFFGYTAFLLSVIASILVCLSFYDRDFLILRIFLAFIYIFMLGILCVALSSKLQVLRCKVAMIEQVEI